MYNMIEPDCIHAVALGIHWCWRVFCIWYFLSFFFQLSSKLATRSEEWSSEAEIWAFVNPFFFFFFFFWLISLSRLAVI